MRKSLVALVGVVLGCGAAWAQGAGVLGVWREPAGAKIEVHPCGAEVCAKLLKLSDDAPGTNDGNNPDKSLRTRPLVGMEIGTGFHLGDASHADGGLLYDPKSGKTYHGSMTSEGDSLEAAGVCGDQGVWADGDLDAGYRQVKADLLAKACPAGRARCARGGPFGTGLLCRGAVRVWGLPLVAEQ